MQEKTSGSIFHTPTLTKPTWALPQNVAFWKGNPRLFEGKVGRLVKYYNLVRKKWGEIAYCLRLDSKDHGSVENGYNFWETKLSLPVPFSTEP